MRRPLKSKSQGSRSSVASVRSFPSPVGGINARDSLASMPPIDAIALENWFPRTTDCVIRGGFTSHVTGFAAGPKTLAVYNPPSGNSKMFAATASAIYDVSSSGVVGAAVAAVTNSKLQSVSFGDGTNNYLILCNGTDKPLYYNGTTWVSVDAVSSPALTGVTSSTLISPMVFKGRLIFIKNNSLEFWYLPASVAGGALTKFDLSSIAKKGGKLIAMATWTFDGGSGPDDYAVFATSKGEVIIYSGTDPSSASAWKMVGTYDVGEPIGSRCMTKFGGDLVILTQNGAFPMSSAIQSATIDSRTALTNKIENEFNNLARTYRNTFGWESTLFPNQSAFIVNVPIEEGGEHNQYVMNTITKSWCKFTGWNAETFCVFNGELYFASGLAVNKGWTGTSDGGNNIVAYGKQAFSYFGASGQLKHFKLFRPVLAVNGGLSFLTEIDVDFSDAPIIGQATYSVTSSATWDASLWDQASWSAGLEVVKHWSSPSAYPGYCAAGKIKIATKSLSVEWMASDYVFEIGGSA